MSGAFVWRLYALVVCGACICAEDPSAPLRSARHDMLAAKQQGFPQKTTPNTYPFRKCSAARGCSIVTIPQIQNKTNKTGAKMK